MRGIQIASLCAWLNAAAAASTGVILEDSNGNCWLLVIAPDGNVGTRSDPGPATPDVILANFSGGNWTYWKLIVNTAGLRTAEPNAGPATTPVPTAGGWTIIVDSSGQVGATL
jgi:hypothetical protein